MIKVLESSYLKDEFINKNLISNINLTDNISFSKNDIFYLFEYPSTTIAEKTASDDPFGHLRQFSLT